jgi:RNA polymerase sigma factor (sigma-70 family)
MHYPAVNPQPDHPQPEADARRRYEDALVRAMRFAERHLARDQALEIAHEVASEMLRLPSDRATGTLIYVAVTSRLRSFWRSTQRRAALEGAYHEMLSRTPTVWSDPGVHTEMGELRTRIQACVDAMPAGMRAVFILIREEELSYKEAAARLGLSVATVHTQIARASLLLRECVAQYRADAPSTSMSVRKRSP